MLSVILIFFKPFAKIERFAETTHSSHLIMCLSPIGLPISNSLLKQFARNSERERFLTYSCVFLFYSLTYFVPGVHLWQQQFYKLYNPAVVPCFQMFAMEYFKNKVSSHVSVFICQSLFDCFNFCGFNTFFPFAEHNRGGKECRF